MDPSDHDQPIDIRMATSADDLEAARILFREYADSLGVDLGFQGFSEELARLPGKYAPPRGRLWVAWDGATPVGCVALRPNDERTGEMKRLYLRDAARGRGVGRQLAVRVLDAASEIGYEAVRLDTVPAMQAAISLYRSLGFHETAPYTVNPVPGALFLEYAVPASARGGS